MKWPNAVLNRFVFKVVTDFTGIVQFRHPNEVGGAQWSFGQFTSFVILFSALYLADRNDKFDDEILIKMTQIAYVMTTTAGISISIFFSIMNKGYAHTFFSIETGGQKTIMRIIVVGRH